MFTGLVEEVGHIKSIIRKGRMIDLTVSASTVLDDAKIGDSIAINGVCLTVTVFGSTSFTVQAVDETMNRTTLGSAKQGRAVNLERSMRLGDRLGGHLVQGHVDGTGRIVSIKGNADNALIGIAIAPELERYIAEKGSITIDGVSLTVTYVKRGEFGVSIIPHTLQATTLEKVKVGDHVNLETDVIAKYVERLMAGGDGLTVNRLKELGF